MKAINLKKARTGLIATILFTIASTLSLTSCDDIRGDIYYNDLVGVWELTGAPFYEVSQFQFNYDGSGYYSAYDYYGNCQSWYFTYEIRGSQIRIDLWDGQTWFYRYQTRGDMLILIDMQMPGNTLYYRYVY